MMTSEEGRDYPCTNDRALSGEQKSQQEHSSRLLYRRNNKQYDNV